MNMILYLLLKKENIPFFAIYSTQIYVKIFLILLFCIIAVVAILFVPTFPLLLILFKIQFFIGVVLFGCGIQLLISIKSKNKKFELDLINRYKQNGNLSIGEYNYINSFFIENYGEELKKNDYSVRSVERQIVKIIGSSIIHNQK